MSANGTGRACRTRAHWGKSLEIYDSLPRELRDRLKIPKNDLCDGCIRAKLRGLIRDFELSEAEAVAELVWRLDNERTFEKVRQGREVGWLKVEDLRP